MSEHPVPWWRWLSGTLLSCLLATHLQAQSPAETRVALVIGNAAYAQQVLDNPTHDADAVAGALARLGFIVIRSSDASKARMEAAIAQAREALQGRRGVGLFYYAGHALQLEWRNFLVPVDARLTSARDVPSQTVDLQKVLDAFQAAGTRMNIVVLDACRDNPFGATGRGNGLAPMDAPWGSFLAYAIAAWHPRRPRPLTRRTRPTSCAPPRPKRRIGSASPSRRSQTTSMPSCANTPAG